jgi:hypothetical protein
MATNRRIPRKDTEQFRSASGVEVRDFSRMSLL